MTGTTKNGALFDQDNWLSIEICHDPPPRPLTPGQLSMTYCYDDGLPVAVVWKPAPVVPFYLVDEVSTEYEEQCPDPYDKPPDAPALRPKRKP